MATEGVPRGTLADEGVALTLEDGKNAKALVCIYCTCKILPVNTGTMDTRTITIPPTMAPAGSTDVEDVSAFWHVPDMWLFDNIGFLHAVGDHKYICCADCERGPLGLMLVSTKEIFVAADRVHYLR